MKERQIKFRGWDAIGDRGWVYGDLVHNKKVTETGLDSRVMVGGYEVIPASVGQFTGLYDCVSGKEVYEGDIVIVSGMSREEKTVVFYEQRFCIASKEEYSCLLRGEHPFLNDYAHLPCIGDQEFCGSLRIVSNIAM